MLVNELGEIALDHHLLSRIDERTVVLASGCVCCTIRADLADELRDLEARRARGEIPGYERVAIETTGLADPAPILSTLLTDPMVEAQYRIDGIVTTVDAVNGIAQLRGQPEAAKQAAVADRLLITKSDLVEPERARRAARAGSRASTPARGRSRCRHGRLPASEVIGAAARDDDGGAARRAALQRGGRRARRRRPRARRLRARPPHPRLRAALRAAARLDDVRHLAVDAAGRARRGRAARQGPAQRRRQRGPGRRQRRPARRSTRRCTSPRGPTTTTPRGSC